MKKILLSSAAVFAFAGAAAAEVTWSGDATLGYNDEIEGGAFIEANLDILMATELDNGWTAAATFGFEIIDSGGGSLTNGNFSADQNFTLGIFSEEFGVAFGDVAFAPELLWSSGVTNMENETFSEQDDEVVLRARANYGGFSAAFSAVADTTRYSDQGNLTGLEITGTGEFSQMAAAIRGDIGAFSVTLAHQEAWEGTTFADDGVVTDSCDDSAKISDADGCRVPDGPAFDNEDFYVTPTTAISVGVSFAGADWDLAYATDDGSGRDSLGLGVLYATGPLSFGAFYSVEDGTDDNYGVSAGWADGPFSLDGYFHGGTDEDYGIHADWDVGNGIEVFAGYEDDDGAYVGGTYDLGGGAQVLASYGDEPNNDEIGPYEIRDGLTVELTFTF